MIAKKEKEKVEKEKGPSGYQLMILQGLQNMKLYAGTVDPYEVWLRRKANKRARRSRRVNRLRIQGKN